VPPAHHGHGFLSFREVLLELQQGDHRAAQPQRFGQTFAARQQLAQPVLRVAERLQTGLVIPHPGSEESRDGCG